jgi:hypothetical protein
MTREQVYDDNGHDLFTFNAAAANRSLEIIGKHVEVAAFKDLLEVSGGQSMAERIRAAKEYSRRADQDQDEETRIAATGGDGNV